jgi:hypothetical protein
LKSIIFNESSHLISADIKTLLKSILSVTYRWRKMVLTIRFWFKVDWNIMHNIFNLRDTEVIICIILVLVKVSRCPHPLYRYWIEYKGIVSYNRETTVNFEPKSYCQYHLSSSVRNWQNTFQQCFDICRDKMRWFVKDYWFHQCLSPLTLSGRIPLRPGVTSVQHYVIKFVSESRHVGCFLRVPRFSPPIKLTPWYNWNIVESGVKHHYYNPKHVQV